MKALLLLLLAAAVPGARAWADTYPMQAGNPQRWNQALTSSTLKLPFNTNWISQTTFSSAVYGGPMVMPNQVLISRYWNVQSVDRATGAVQWTFVASGPDGDDLFGIPETPTYDPDRNCIYISDATGITYGVSPTGQTLWMHTDQGTGEDYASPLYANNEIYAPTGGNGLICLNPDTQAVVWRAGVTAGYSLLSPALDNGELYVPTVEGTVFCLNASDGSLVWQVDTGTEEGSTVLVQGQYFYRNCSLGLVECRSISTGALVWSYQCASFTDSDMAFSGGLLIVTNDDRHVRAFDASTGQLIWDRNFLGNFARCAPIVVCGQIFVSGCASQFYGLDGQSGDTLWAYTYAFSNAFTDWAVADGHLYTADPGGNLYDFTSVTPGDPSDCTGLQAWTRTVSPTISQTSTISPTFTVSPVCSPTQTGTHTPTFTDTPVVSATPTDTQTSTDTPTHTSTDTPAWSATATPTVTPDYSATPTPTQTAIPYFMVTPATATETFTVSPVCSPTQTDTLTPAITSTSAKTSTPTLTDTLTSVVGPEPEPTSSAGCVARIENLEVFPDPFCATSNAARHAGVLLGPCGAQSLKCRVYSLAMVQAGNWTVDCSSQPGGWHTINFPSSLRLASGVYYLSVEAVGSGAPAHSFKPFMVLP